MSRGVVPSLTSAIADIALHPAKSQAQLLCDCYLAIRSAYPRESDSTRKALIKELYAKSVPAGASFLAGPLCDDFIDTFESMQQVQSKRVGCLSCLRRASRY
jgi:hypothetical protein